MKRPLWRSRTTSLNGEYGREADIRPECVSGPIPADAVTTSASGLDPDISPEYALAQAAAVAEARDLPED
jgi:K+-transporting ATPase c subunit